MRLRRVKFCGLRESCYLGLAVVKTTSVLMSFFTELNLGEESSGLDYRSIQGILFNIFIGQCLFPIEWVVFLGVRVILMWMGMGCVESELVWETYFFRRDKKRSRSFRLIRMKRSCSVSFSFWLCAA